MAQTLTYSIHVEGGRELLAAFRRLPKEANKSLRERTLELSRALAKDIAGVAIAEGGQAALMAPTVKAVFDRVPAVSAGGTKRVGRHKVQAWQLLFASEFGMNRRSGWYAASRYDQSTGRQYKPHRGRASYWFFRTVERGEPTIVAAWRQVADDIVSAWVRDGV